MNDGIDGEVVLRAGGREARLPAISTEILQALHNSITGAQEAHQLSKSGMILCNENDIGQLSKLLSQWVDQYSIISAVEKINCVCFGVGADNTTKSFSFKSFDSFMEHYPARTEVSKRISFVYDFVLRNPNTETVDRVSLEVEIRANSDPDFMTADEETLFYHEDKLPDLAFSAVFRVQYTNYLVAKALLDVADAWFKSLPTQELPKPPRLSKVFSAGARGHDRLNFAFWIMVVVTAIFSINFGYFGYSLLPTEFRLEKNLASIMVLLAGAFFLFVSYFMKRLSGVHSMLARHLNVTVGDKRKIRDCEIAVKRFEKREERYSNYIVGSLMFGFLASILASFLVG